MLATVCAEIRHLTCYPLILQNILSTTKPFENDDYQPLHSRQLPQSCCVLHKGDFVFKVFDKKTGKPNIEVLRMAGISHSVENMTQDDRLQILKYEYIDGSHQPQSLSFSGGV